MRSNAKIIDQSQAASKVFSEVSAHEKKVYKITRRDIDNALRNARAAMDRNELRFLRGE